jgi:alkanesulfonate monooxygenase SsuD/methylene tetrahydromethanopterin reductase-like flavin-dependent oxidoreductase (luciferase family)
MRPLEIGLALTTLEDIPSGNANSWKTLSSMARRVEELGFDTLWLADEFLWKVDKWPGNRGFWEAASLFGALAATTSRIRLGSWVFSALHRNPAMTVRIAETLDEIAGGRFVFGFGSGHDGNSSFGYPTDNTVARYAEALEIVVPLLHEGQANFAGRYHRVEELENRPRGPRPGRIPLMLAGNRPRTIALAARHADMWSALASGDSRPEAFAERIRIAEQACADIGRDPASLKKSASVWVQASSSLDPSESIFGEMLPGDPARLAEAAHQFAELGFTSLELALIPENPDSLEDVGPLVQLLDR